MEETLKNLDKFDIGGFFVCGLFELKNDDMGNLEHRVDVLQQQLLRGWIFVQN